MVVYLLLAYVIVSAQVLLCLCMCYTYVYVCLFVFTYVCSIPEYLPKSLHTLSLAENEVSDLNQVRMYS